MLPSPSLQLQLLSLALFSALAAAAPSPSPAAAPVPTALPRRAVSLAPAAHPAAPASQPTGLHLPLHRRNGHLHGLSRRSRPEQADVVKGWAVREKGRLAGKYGVSEDRLRRRAQDAARTSGDGHPELSAEAGGEDTADERGDREGRKGRRRLSGADEGELERRQLGGDLGGVLSSRTAFSTAGFGSATGTASSSSSTSEINTAPTSVPTRQVMTGEVHLLNYDADLSYYAPVGIGVPAQYLNCILDTGSADLWVASDYCSAEDGCTSSIPLYNSTLSNTSLDMNTSFSVKYGSGSAQGEVFQDYVAFAGYNVSSQAFALIESVSTDLLSGEISGLMGLGWHPLAASAVTPFWQNLWQASVLPFPGFGVSLTRFIDVPNASAIEPGGSITFGYLNASLYSSEINYVDIPSGMESYWLIPLDNVAVNGTNVTSWGAAQRPNAAIDTGTTLIGGPRDVISRIYGQVEGAQPATGVYTGYYSYPCDSNVTVSFTFGGITYDMEPADFNLGPFGIDTATNRSTCLGAFFDLNFSGGSRISWVIGAAFLKNVYSVYRASPPSVGFALPPNSSAPIFPSFPSNSSDPAHDGNVTVLPGGIYGPSGGISIRTTLVPANTVTTAVQAGETVGRVPSSGVGRRAGEGLGGWAALAGATAAAVFAGTVTLVGL